MSRALARIAALFVEASEAAPTPPVVAAGRAPVVAVLCAEAGGRTAAGAVALALADAVNAPCALAAVATRLVATAPSLGLAVRAARHAAARSGGRASGRLVWLPDRPPSAADPTGAAAAACAALGRAAAQAGLPAAIALPLARTAALDRVLGWHDAVVAVIEPPTSDAVAARVAASLTALGRPVACVGPSSRRAALLAELGVRAPAELAVAVARMELGTGDGPCP